VKWGTFARVTAGRRLSIYWYTATLTTGTRSMPVEAHSSFVDPEGLRSERAHDLSVPMREYNQPLLAGDTTLWSTNEQGCLPHGVRLTRTGVTPRALPTCAISEADEGMDSLKVATRYL
jgi:hypothetical protein